MVKKHIPYIIIFLLLFFLVLQCHTFNSTEIYNRKNISALSDSVIHYKNKLGLQTASIKTLQLKEKQLQKDIIKKDHKLAAFASEFSKIKSVTDYQSVMQIDTVFIPLTNNNDTLPRFNYSGSHTDMWYSMKFRINNDSLLLSKFQINTKTTVITGFKRKWLLGKQTVVTDVINSNPYITITDLKAAEMNIPKPWYDK